MSNTKKELTKKQKNILYIITAVASVAVAIGATILLITLVKNPPDFVFSNNNHTFSSRLSALSNFDDNYLSNEPVNTTPSQSSQNQSMSVNTSSEQTPGNVNQENTSNTPASNNSTSDKASSAVKPTETNPNLVVVKNYTVDTSKLEKRKIQLPVKFLSQNPELPSGSEITSLTTVLNFYGYNVSKVDMATKHLVKSNNKTDDFRTVYIGDPATDGLGCYAKPIADAANSYLSSNNKMYTAVDYSGAKFEKLLKLIESDIPVIIWGTTYNEETKTLNEPLYSDSWTLDGEKITWIEPEHCMVLIGYNLDNHTAIVCDPMRGIVEYDIDTVKARYLALDSQCVVLKQSEYAPVTGINNGATYYTTQCVSVTKNKDIASITLNNVEKGNVFLLPGNKNETYDIVITYKNDDTIKYTVYTKPISAMLDPLQHANEHTVTENDINTINAVKNLAQSVERKYSPYSETEAVENVLSACDLMLDNIKIAKEKLNAAKEKANTFESSSSTTPDIEKLVAFRTELDALNTIQNLTPAQKMELSNLIAKCSGWISSLQVVE